MIGIREPETRQDLLKVRNLTLEKCIDICRSAEDASTQSRTIHPEVAACNTNQKGKARYNKKPDQSKQQARTTTFKSPTGVTPHQKSFKRPTRQDYKPPNSNPHGQCGFCGYSAHNRIDCPARRATYSSCQKIGHYHKMCRSKHKTGGVDGVEPGSDWCTAQDTFLGHVQDASGHEWMAQINVDGRPRSFKPDTGASVTVIGEETGVNLINLRKSDTQFRAVGVRQLEVLGFFTGTLSYRGRSIQEKLYVVKGQTSSLLSRNACVKLGLVVRIDNVQANPTPNFETEFPELFQGLGKLEETCSIKLKEDAVPLHIFTLRKIAHPLLPQVKKEIDRMLSQGVISEMTEPTEWCAGMVVVPKPSGSVRICVDLTELNKAVKREVHPLNSVDQDLAQLTGSKYFTKLDARSGFWQIPLSEESRKYTTFLTPFGRYCFNRLPFGISSTSEIFQRRMNKILSGLDGFVCHTDDILVHAADKETHDRRLRQVMERLREAGLTLNDKCEFSKSSLKFLGHIIDATGIRADPGKIEAIKNFPQPQNITELQRFLGLANQLAKFTPRLAVHTEPLRQLLKKDRVWIWEQPQDNAFYKVKEQLTTTPVLAHYSPHSETMIAADASNMGLGAVLLQVQHDGTRKPVSFISRSLTDAEKNYAVIEKEALAATWASERFSEYVLGLKYTIETDHKPLVPLLMSKELSKLPPRIQRFRLRLTRFSPEVKHVSGKSQITADTLSRAPTRGPCKTDLDLYDDVLALLDQTFKSLPVTLGRLMEIITKQKADPEILEVRRFCTTNKMACLHA